MSETKRVGPGLHLAIGISSLVLLLIFSLIPIFDCPACIGPDIGLLDRSDGSRFKAFTFCDQCNGEIKVSLYRRLTLKQGD